MKFMNRKTLAVGLSVGFAGAALAGPSLALAKSYKTSWKVAKANPQVGTKISATYKGTPIGTCKMTGTLVIPETRQNIKCKGGSFYMVAKSTQLTPTVKGTWKASKGKGKFKGIKGGGTFSGLLADSKFTYKGTLSY